MAPDGLLEIANGERETEADADFVGSARLVALTDTVCGAEMADGVV